ncbi:alpha/beta hydrolase [Bacillus songklensis]|uniref:Alpha/beta hydrolase n=1 Tax=Bacillus songklensis TaxID=1069116 RepID=A0ABV8B5L3_9BACI
MEQSVYRELKPFQARNGSTLYYRYYPAESNHVIILLHGICEDSKYLKPMAEFISREHLAHVYTLDLRGYGQYPERRGDVDYIGQIENDLMDLIEFVKHDHPESTLIMAGHSAGGGTAIRFAGSKYGTHVDAYLLFAPFVHPDAPTTPKSNPNSRTKVYLSRLVPLILLNKVGVTLFNHWHVLSVNKPKEQYHGTETLHLSYRLLMSRIPEKYEDALRALQQPTLVLIGDKDEDFDHSQYEPLFKRYNRAEVKIINGADHDGLLEHGDAYAEVKNWFAQLT